MSQLALHSQTVARGHPAALRTSLGGLLAFGAVNAFAGGYYGMAGAADVPKEWLEGSPFDSYFIPGLVLFVVVGGSLLAAAIAVFARLPIARTMASAAGAIVLGWLVVETAIMPFFCHTRVRAGSRKQRFASVATVPSARGIRFPPRLVGASGRQSRHRRSECER